MIFCVPLTVKQQHVSDLGTRGLTELSARQLWSVTYTAYTIRYDTLHFRAPKSWPVASLICRREPNEKKSYEETKKPTCSEETVQS